MASVAPIPTAVKGHSMLRCMQCVFELRALTFDFVRTFRSHRITCLFDHTGRASRPKGNFDINCNQSGLDKLQLLRALAYRARPICLMLM